MNATVYFSNINFEAKSLDRSERSFSFSWWEMHFCKNISAFVGKKIPIEDRLHWWSHNNPLNQISTYPIKEKILSRRDRPTAIWYNGSCDLTPLTSPCLRCLRKCRPQLLRQSTRRGGALRTLPANVAPVWCRDTWAC